MKGCEHDGTLLEDECWCVVKILRAPNSYAVRRMLQALAAAEDYGVQSALDQGFNPDAQVLWIDSGDDADVINVYPPPKAPQAYIVELV